MRIVFDLDDTISTHINRDYENATPILETVEKMRQLKEDGCEIVIHTARGQVSCNGDLALIEARNRAQIIRWLKKHDVPCDELIFGKPIGDLYVDDKAVNLADFHSGTFGMLHGGGSNKPIYRLGKTVKKMLGSVEDTARFREWVEDNAGACKFPRVISCLYNAVYMDFIEGKNLVDCFTDEDFAKVLFTILEFSKRRKAAFDITPHIEILEGNYSSDKEMNGIIDLCKRFITHHKEAFHRHASYSHGDMILSNIIKGDDGQLYFIDPRYFRESSSYLLDFAKLRMSLSGYEYAFGISEANNTAYLATLDCILKRRGIYDIVVGLHLMYIIRLYRYKDEKGKQIVKTMAKGMIDKNGQLFSE